MNEQHETFLKSADLGIIGAVKSVCRRRYEKTVKVLDSLSELELEVVRQNGLLSLPQPKISELEKAMTQDNFQWSV